MNNGELETREIQGPSGLLSSEFLLCRKIDQIAMIGPNFKVIVPSFQVMAKNFQGANNGEEFFIMNFIVVFSWLQCF